MNGGFLILFVILLLGLILSSFLGGSYHMEGFTNDSNSLTFTSSDGSNAVVSNYKSSASVTSNDGSSVSYTKTNTQNGPYGDSILYTSSNGGSAILTTGSTGVNVFKTKDANGSNQVNFTSTDSTATSSNNGSSTTNGSYSNNGPSTTNYDNYNHFDGSSYPTVFYGPNGATARVIQTGNNNTLVITNKNGTTEIYYINKDVSNTTVKSYYGPNGASAKIVTTSDGKQVVEITTQDGSKIIYTGDNTNSTNNQDDTINQYSADTNTTGSDYNNAFSASTYMNPISNLISGPSGNTYSTYDTSAYTNSLPQGIPKSMIPSGQEDLYILKSQVVPPVCPVCPTPIVQPSGETDVTKCPPCPPCSRCPEPSFSCAKVPNYNAFNPDTMPVPVLNDFSSFGM